MKLTVKYIMSPLLFGGLILSLYITIAACYRSAASTGENYAYKPLTACRVLKNDAPALCTRILEKFITH